MLSAFRMHEPTTVAEASALLAEYGEEAAVYAGGTELLVLMKEGLSHYPHLVNIKKILGLDGIGLSDDQSSLLIGALATHRRLERSLLVRERLPLLAEVEAQVANVRVRSVGTIGGNLCFAEPHSDPATLLVALGATLELRSASDRREVHAGDFFVGLLETVRRPDELLTGIRVPLLAASTGVAYERFKQHERPTATVAVLLDITDDVVNSARLVVGSVGPIPLRPEAAETLLRGQRPSPGLFAEAAGRVAEAAEVLDDPFDSVEYKRHLVRVLAERALQAALSRGGEMRRAA